MTIYTVGYGRWAPRLRLDRMLRTLVQAGVNLLVDVRHDPCASSSSPESNYGPRDWHLQTGAHGIVPHLEGRGIRYLWLVELGNPQKHDPAMTVLRAHLAGGDEDWPVNRGLERLRDLVRDERNRCCLLCACPSYDACHRKVVAEALSRRSFASALTIENLP